MDKQEDFCSDVGIQEFYKMFKYISSRSARVLLPGDFLSLELEYHSLIKTPRESSWGYQTCWHGKKVEMKRLWMQIKFKYSEIFSNGNWITRYWTLDIGGLDGTIKKDPEVLVCGDIWQVGLTETKTQMLSMVLSTLYRYCNERDQNAFLMTVCILSIFPTLTSLSETLQSWRPCWCLNLHRGCWGKSRIISFWRCEESSKKLYVIFDWRGRHGDLVRHFAPDVSGVGVTSELEQVAGVEHDLLLGEPIMAYHIWEQTCNVLNL